MKGHEQYAELLARRPELSPQEEMYLQDHLRSCPACRETATAYARQSVLLRSLPLVDPPPGLRSRVLAGVRSGGSRAVAGRRWPRFLLLPPLAAALVVALVVLASLHRPHTGSHAALTTRQATPAPTRPPVPQTVGKRQAPVTVRHRVKKPQRRQASKRRPTSRPAPAVFPAPVPGQPPPVVGQQLPPPPAPITTSVPPIQVLERPAPARKAGAPHASAARPTPSATPQSRPAPTSPPLATPPGIGALPPRPAPSATAVPTLMPVPGVSPTPLPPAVPPTPAPIFVPVQPTPTPTP